MKYTSKFSQNIVTNTLSAKAQIDDISKGTYGIFMCVLVWCKSSFPCFTTQIKTAIYATDCLTAATNIFTFLNKTFLAFGFYVCW